MTASRCVDVRLFIGDHLTPTEFTTIKSIAKREGLPLARFVAREIKKHIATVKELETELKK